MIDLHEDVLAEFDAFEADHERLIRLDAILTPPDGRSGKRILRPGFRLTGPRTKEQEAVRSQGRRAYFKAYVRRTRDAALRARLLAGERPKLSGRGRPPSAWIRVAKTLGIQLETRP